MLILTIQLKKIIPFNTIIGFLIVGFSVKAQTVYPSSSFQSPMDTPLYLSAPFGSLRDNHFHSGMDIRTYEKEGLPIYAIADGYVSRIKYSSVGYGKAIYINHPNGYTSVYGHLQNANDHIASYIKKYQYEIQNFEFDHFPGKDKILIKKGDTIAWSGNSGGSTGPHLHFEIRNTMTEEIINPQLFGIPVIDDQVPAIQLVSTYTFIESGSKQLNQYKFNYKNSIETDSGLILLDTMFIPKQLVGFGIDAVDYLTDRKKEYSIYGMDLQIDGKLYYKFRLNQFQFGDSRCINRHIDYALYKEEGNRIQKMFVEEGNEINLYPFVRNKGRYYPVDTFPHQLVFTVYDFLMRYAKVYAYVKASPIQVSTLTERNTVTKCYPNKAITFQNAFVKINIPEKALYDTLNIQYEMLPKEKEMLSATHCIHNIYTPLNKSFSIAIKPQDSINTEWQPKLLLAYASKVNNWRSAGGEYSNGTVVSKSNMFGSFAVTIDTTPPKIKPKFTSNFSANDTSFLSFQITDNFSGINTYKLTINKKWVLAEYDAKNDLLTYYLDENTPKEKLEMELIVTDKKDNQSIFKTKYIRTIK